jgi:hypothetical protein
MIFIDLLDGNGMQWKWLSPLPLGAVVSGFARGEGASERRVIIREPEA